MPDQKKGAEAEDLRASFERVIERSEEYGDRRISVDLIRHVLDEVDARDSLAFLESQKKEDPDLILVDIVFDVTPGNPSPQFIEIEDAVSGNSVKIGTWLETSDRHALRVWVKK